MSLPLEKVVTLGLDGGSVWTIGEGDYQAELWDTTGARMAAWSRDAPWFDPFQRDRGISVPDSPPQAWVRLAKTDPRGRLWVLSTIPASDWQERARANPENCEHPPYDGHEFVSQIVDPDAGEWVDGDNHACVSYRCDHFEHGHTECSSPHEEALNLLALALRTLDGPNLRRFMARNPDRLFWNPERASVQVWGCREGISLTVQITPDRAKCLSSDG